MFHILWSILSMAWTNTGIPEVHSAPNSGIDTISILQTADIHGQLFPHDELFYENNSIAFRTRGGLAHIKSLFDSVRMHNPEGTIILDGGDLIQGSAIAALSEGKAFPPIINEMGYDFLIPGNWEVVYGKKKMLEVLEAYNAPVIAANIYDGNSKDLIYPPYFIKTLKGIKMGFISYDDPEIPIRQNPSFSKGLDFTPVEDNLEALVSELKSQGVDMIFLVTHLGIAKQVHLSKSPLLKDVDYILGNDTHERIRKPIEGEFTKVTEPGAFGSFVGKLDLIFKNGKLIGEEYQLIEVDPDRYPANSKMESLIARATNPYQEEIDEVLGYTSTPLYRYFVVENPMDNLLTDAARWKTGADISLSNGFRFAPPLNVEDGKVSAITRSYLWDMLPVNEYIKTAEASGKQIEAWLEEELHHVFAENPTERFGGWMVRFSGMQVRFKASNPKGNRIESIHIGGEPIDLDRMYTLSACRRDGELLNTLCRMDNCAKPQIQDYTIHQAVEEYFSINDTVSPQREGRAIATDLGPDVLSQLPGTDYHFH